MTTTPTTPPCTTPLDEPRVRDKDRSRYYFWPLTEVPAERLYAHGWTGPELCIYHDRDRKRFWTSLHPTTQYDDGGSSMSISLMTSPSWSKTEPVARFSAKALTSFAERALAELRTAWTAGDAGLREMFSPAVVTVKIEDSYVDGSESTRAVVLDAPHSTSEVDLADWWEDAVYPHTGDGQEHLGDGALYTATITEASDPALVGQTQEWGD